MKAHRLRLLLWWVSASALMPACGGDIREPQRNDDAPSETTTQGRGQKPGAPGMPTPPGGAPKPQPEATPSPTGPMAGGAVQLGAEMDGNRVEQATLFTCSAPTKTSSPPRLWRLTGDQYRNTVKTVVAKLPPNFVNPLGPSGLQTRFSNYASSFGMTELETDTLATSAQVLAQATAASFVGQPTCAGDAASPGCVGPIVKQVGAKLFRRPIDDEELARFTKRAGELKPKLGDKGALEALLELLFASPELAFRTELGAGPRDAEGRQKLTPHEIASALSYTLTDAPPDAQLLAAAEAGQLGSAAQIAAEARRLLVASGGLGASAVYKRFLREYLRYPEVEQQFKDIDGFQIHQVLPTADHWAAGVLAQGKGLLKTLLTSNVGYVKGNDFTVPYIWGLPEKGLKFDLHPREFPGSRFGILTQPAWLIAFSQNQENDPIRRGKYIFESLLCNTVPELPLDVVAVLPEMPGATLRDKMAIHSKEPRCAGCHALMDPIGLALEGYDHTGRTRTTEEGKPVDTRGALVGSGDQDGPVSGPEELTRKLAASKRVSQCFVRHAFRFTFGRSETPADACTLAAAEKVFRDSGEDFAELVVALLGSDSMLYRK